MRTFEIIKWVTLASGDTVRRVRETREYSSLIYAMHDQRNQLNEPLKIDFRIKDNELIAFHKDSDDVELLIIREYKEI